MFGRCSLRLRQCIQFARKFGVLSRRSAPGSGALVTRYRQVHAPCEVETGSGHKRCSAKRAHRCGILGYKGARRKRLAQRSPWEADTDVNRQISNLCRIVFADRGRITGMWKLFRSRSPTDVSEATALYPKELMSRKEPRRLALMGSLPYLLRMPPLPPHERPATLSNSL